MNLDDRNVQGFLTLVRAGLWEKNINPCDFYGVDFGTVKHLAHEQTLVGLVAVGLSHIQEDLVSKKIILQFIGEATQIEHGNKLMNSLIVRLAEQLQREGITFTLVKGQGIAQCYERPMWRSYGDVDLLLDDENYNKAKGFILRYDKNLIEVPFDLHSSANIDGWTIELHGSMRGMLTKRADDLIDEVQREMFENKQFRFWYHNGASIPLPSPDNDVIFVFTHFIKHFFHSGVGLRQLCDWCRLIFTFHSELDTNLLRTRIQTMGLMSEWKAFAALAVGWLGMPSDAMPFYSTEAKWRRKAKRILVFVLLTGNFGHNRDHSFLQKYPNHIARIISIWYLTCDSVRRMFIFPLDSARIWLRFIEESLKNLMLGK